MRSQKEVEEEVQADEQALIDRARAGDRSATEALIRRHQRWIYNISLRMVGNLEEAEDLSQEILIKAFRKIGTFEGRSGLRTWLYRIAVNQYLSMRETEAERYMRLDSDKWANDAFVRDYFDSWEIDIKSYPPDLRLVAEEVRMKCILGMLLCLGRRQRLVYILGDALMVGSKAGAAALGMSEACYRQTLSRARRRVRQFMEDRCGLVSPGKPCTCERNLAACIGSGYVDPLHLAFSSKDAPRIRDTLDRVARSLSDVACQKCRELYWDLPLQDSPDFAGRVLSIVESNEMRFLLDVASGA